MVRNWRVHPDDFSSDHQLIEFVITISAQSPLYSQNWKLGDFCIFRKCLDEMMTSPRKSWSARLLEGAVEHFHVSIMQGLKKHTQSNHAKNHFARPPGGTRRLRSQGERLKSLLVSAEITVKEIFPSY